MGSYNISKGYDIRLAGKPSAELAEGPVVSVAAVYPLEFKGVKQRLKVAEGDTVKRGSVLLEDKRDVRFKICAPAGGKVKSIKKGARRFVEEIVVEIDDSAGVEEFRKYQPAQLTGLDRQEIIDQLLRTGYLAFIRQRPFSVIPDVGKVPKSIFVNAMNTAPFLADANVVVENDRNAFQAGLDIMARLTDGKVHLCVGADAGEGLKSARNVEIHTFTGPHPSGNTSVHIDRVDPMSPTDIVWTVMAVDLVLIGRLFLDGALPAERIIALGGAGIKEAGRKHYRVRVGGSLAGLVKGFLNEGEQRAVSGGVLSGTKVELDGCIRFYQSSLTVVPEGRERYFLGWMEPGFNQYSFTRLCASTFLSRQRTWNLTTNRKGGERAMVLTGHYDRVMPMNIMVDYLIRAVLAGDTDEAISLGILETDPEDFALCDFICPCKLEVQEIIRRGLKQIEDEGI